MLFTVVDKEYFLEQLFQNEHTDLLWVSNWQQLRTGSTNRVYVSSGNKRNGQSLPYQHLRLSKRAKTRRFLHFLCVYHRPGRVENFDEFFIFSVFFSTRKKGDPPDDSKSFWSKLMSNDLSFNFGSRFTFFAMGDSSYPKFNWVGLSMARRFEARFGKCKTFERTLREVLIKIRKGILLWPKSG